MAGEQEDPRSPQAAKLLDCDIVMAGGVTSGIIYPGAVAMIAQRYAFHSIGGTSVGAIAAAVTAAAEYGRRTGLNPQTFAELEMLPKSLGHAAADGRSRLFHLFTPEPATRKLFALVTPLFRGGRGIASVPIAVLTVWQIAVPVGLAALAGLGLIVALLLDGRPLQSLVGLVAAAALVLVVLLAMLAVMLGRVWLPAWRANGYGICTGLASPQVGKQPDQAAFEGLTPWMHRVVQAAAGRRLEGPPLTFGDLWSLSLAEGAQQAEADPAEPRAIDLVMIASDISRNHTAQLPFLETPSPLYVEKAVLERYFPATILQWMKDNAGHYDDRVDKRDDVIRLPKPEHLPIVFGARLSLSFPVLLSAVPLMTPDFARHPKGGGPVPLRRVWFSDGGLTSNFPIHFFDSPIPSRPTFCLNLIDFEAETSVAAPDGAADSADVKPAEADKPVARARAPQRTAANRPKVVPSGDPQPGDKVWELVSMSVGNRVTPVPFTAFDEAEGAGLVSFVLTLVNTARFWSDNQMLIAPGIRDRVVNIALRNDEGGLNLDMPSNTIDDLDQRGRAAGLLIAARFDPKALQDPETGAANKQVFANHRWVRYRNFMAAFEDLSRRFARSRRKSDAAAAARGESLLEAMIEGRAKEKIGYPAPPVARHFYRETTVDLERLALKMAAATRADADVAFDTARPPGGGKRASGAAPRPKMRLRMRPLTNTDPQAETAELPHPHVAADVVQARSGTKDDEPY